MCVFVKEVKHPIEKNRLSSFEANIVKTVRNRKKCSNKKVQSWMVQEYFLIMLKFFYFLFLVYFDHIIFKVFFNQPN